MTPAVVSALLVAAAVSLAMQPVVCGWLVRRDLLDRPNHRSSHVEPVPRGGGIGISVGLLAGLGVGLQRAVTAQHVLAVSVALLCLCFAALGLVDDRRPLPAATRLVVQFGLAVFGVAVLAAALGTPRDTEVTVVVLTLVGVLWIPAYTNAFNFMDGINGIAALQGIAAGAFYAWVAIGAGRIEVALLAAATAGGCLGFLPWNLPRARLFMGDVGSYAVGSLLACTSLWLFWQGTPLLLCVAPLTVFIVDTGWTLLRRLVSGRPVMRAHREHIYQQLADGGWSHQSVAGLTVAVACGCAAISTAGTVTPVLSSVAIAALLAAYLAMPTVLGRNRSGSRVWVR